jgi:hypothetical protein
LNGGYYFLQHNLAEKIINIFITSLFETTILYCCTGWVDEKTMDNKNGCQSHEMHYIDGCTATMCSHFIVLYGPKVMSLKKIASPLKLPHFFYITTIASSCCRYITVLSQKGNGL